MFPFDDVIMQIPVYVRYDHSSLNNLQRPEWVLTSHSFMTSSNGTIFRVTGPLCGEFTGPGDFPTQRPVTRSFDVFFDLRLNKRLSKQPWGWWFETPPWSLWCQCVNINEINYPNSQLIHVISAPKNLMKHEFRQNHAPFFGVGGRCSGVGRSGVGWVLCPPRWV